MQLAKAPSGQSGKQHQKMLVGILIWGVVLGAAGLGVGRSNTGVAGSVFVVAAVLAMAQPFNTRNLLASVCRSALCVVFISQMFWLATGEIAHETPARVALGGLVHAGIGTILGLISFGLFTVVRRKQQNCSSGVSVQDRTALPAVLLILGTLTLAIFCSRWVETPTQTQPSTIPRINAIIWRIEPPSYTGLAPRTARDRPDVPLEVSIGSRLNAQVELDQSSVPVRMSSGIIGDWMTLEDTPTEWFIADSVGDKEFLATVHFGQSSSSENTLPLRLLIKVKPDNPPQLTIDDIPREANLAETVQFSATVEDDYGVADVVLEFWSDDPNDKQRIALLPAEQRGKKRVVVSQKFDFRAWMIQAGERASFSITATDFCPQNAERVTKSDVISIAIR